MKKRVRLIAARARKGWTLEQASERIGCAPNTLNRWELGGMTPSAYFRERLCCAYDTTPEVLGIEVDEMITLSRLGAADAIQTFLHADLTMLLYSIVSTHQCSCRKLQYALERTIEEFTPMNTGHEAALTRREALQRLAALFPLALLTNGGEQRPMEETLKQCAAGITACRYLSHGKYEEMTIASSALSTYLPALKTIFKESSLHRKEAANLLAQCYLLKQVLGLHLENPGVTKGYGKRAVTYSQESGDLVLGTAALRRLTWAYLQEKQPQQALQTIEKAESLVKQNAPLLSSHVQSSVLSTLAVLQARNGLSADTALHLAKDTFFLGKEVQEKGDPHAPDKRTSVDFSEAQLMRNEGLAFYHQGFYTEALSTYAQIIDSDDLTPKIAMPARTHIELLHQQLTATMKSTKRDMEQATKLWTAEMQGAIGLRSQQRFDDACMAYEVMGAIWPQESRISSLHDLIVHW